MYATNFEFAGERLSDYGMIICDFGGGGLETVSSGSDITFNQIALNKGNRFFIGSATYDSALTSTFTIAKNPCLAETQEDMYLPVAEISALQRWLCRKEYHKFKIDQEEFYDIYWNVTFSAKQIELGGKIVGLELTLYADAPFAYADEITIEMDWSSGSINPIECYDLSDEIGVIYPNIQIEFLMSGHFNLWNELESERKMIINHCSKGEVITIKGKEHIISSSTGRSLSSDFNYIFPRLLNSYTENKNTFNCDLLCKVTLSYSPIRKVGI